VAFDQASLGSLSVAADGSVSLTLRPLANGVVETLSIDAATGAIQMSVPGITLYQDSSPSHIQISEGDVTIADASQLSTIALTSDGNYMITSNAPDGTPISTMKDFSGGGSQLEIFNPNAVTADEIESYSGANATGTLTGETVDLLPGIAAAAIDSSNATINVQANSGLDIAGSSDTINLGASSTLSVTGSDDTIAIDGSSDMVVASNETIDVGSNETVTITGRGDTIDVQGSGDRLNVSGATINLASGVKATIDGTNDHASGRVNWIGSVAGDTAAFAGAKWGDDANWGEHTGGRLGPRQGGASPGWDADEDFGAQATRLNRLTQAMGSFGAETGSSPLSHSAYVPRAMTPTIASPLHPH
jgi:hypothetical protein